MQAGSPAIRPAVSASFQGLLAIPSAGLLLRLRQGMSARSRPAIAASLRSAAGLDRLCRSASWPPAAVCRLQRRAACRRQAGRFSRSSDQEDLSGLAALSLRRPQTGLGITYLLQQREGEDQPAQHAHQQQASRCAPAAAGTAGQIDWIGRMAALNTDEPGRIASGTRHHAASAAVAGHGSSSSASTLPAAYASSLSGRAITTPFRGHQRLR